MNSDIIVGAIIAAPAIALLFLRSNAALVFLSLCLGSVLAQTVANDATQVIGAVSNVGSVNTTSNVSLALLALPPLLTAIFMIKSVKKSQIVLQLIPALSIGAAVLILSRPYLPKSIVGDLAKSSLWTTVDNLAVAIIGASALFCILIIWMQRPKHSSHDEKHK